MLFLGILKVNKEGTGTGFDLNLASKITNICKIPYIINGGFGKKSHINELLNVCNPSGIAISSAFHYNLVKNFSKRNKSKMQRKSINKLSISNVWSRC